MPFCRLEQELNACKNAMQSLEAEVQAELDAKGWNKKSLPDRITELLQQRKIKSNLANAGATLPATRSEEVRCREHWKRSPYPAFREVTG